MMIDSVLAGKTQARLVSLLLMLAFLLTGCMPVPPTPVPTLGPTFTPAPPTPTPVPSPTATPSVGDRLDQLFSALSAVNQSPNLNVSMELKQTGTVTQTVTNQVRRVQQGSSWNVELQRACSYPESEQLHNVQGQLRQVDGVVYAAGLDHNVPSGSPAFPAAWVPVDPPITFLFWPGLTQLGFENALVNLHSDAWSLLIGQSLDQFRATVASNLEGLIFEYSQVTNGATQQVFTLTFNVDAFPKGVRSACLSASDFQASPGSLITLRVTLDAVGQLVSWQQTIPMDADGAQEIQIEVKPEGSLPMTIPDLPASPTFTGLSAEMTPPFRTLDEFDASLSAALQNGSLEAFWQQIVALRQMPLIFGDQAIFLYKGPATQVAWEGDWKEGAPDPGQQLAEDLWFYNQQFPLDARLEYRLQLDGDHSITDPLNPVTEEGGLAAKSVLAMPAYVFPAFTLLDEHVARGELSGDLTIQSDQLGYAVHYRVYTPVGYTKLRSLPVLYVTDGQDFIQFGKMVTVLDNLIAQKKIRPIIVVFINSRDVETGQDLGEEQFFDNARYGNFITKELVPIVDTRYYTNRTADARAILGAAGGGYHAAYFALNHSDRFHLIAMQSPSFGYQNGALVDAYRETRKLSLKLFLSTGVYEDNLDAIQQMKAVFKSKEYPLLYIESNEGHSYGSWRGRFEAMLTYFFAP